MTADLTQRLLSAARQTYSIKDDGPVPAFGSGPAAPSSACVGWLPNGGPHGVRAGLFHQDAGFVGSIPEGVVVAIRGTTPPSPGQDLRQVVIDWASDAVATLETAAGSPPGFPGKVHFGFYKSFMRLWLKLQPLVAAAVAASPQDTIFVTGHSKGGAICPLVAWRLHMDFPYHRIIVRAFAPARIADDVFAAAYAAKITDHVRYEYDDDIVPHMPLEPSLITALGVPPLVAWLLSKADLDYSAVGQLGYIQQDGTIVPDSEGLEAQRVSRLVTRLASAGGPQYVASCHGLETGDGYVKAAYPS